MATNSHVLYSHSPLIHSDFIFLSVLSVLAQEDDIKWLLHIDSDELFYMGTNNNHNHVSAHFQQLENLKFDTGSFPHSRTSELLILFISYLHFLAVYLNYEGVVEEENIDSQNYFLSTTLFKKSPIVINDAQSIYQHSSWMRGKWYYFAGIPLITFLLFLVFLSLIYLGYWTGKSAARVTKNVYPIEVLF